MADNEVISIDTNSSSPTTSTEDFEENYFIVVASAVTLIIVITLGNSLVLMASSVNKGLFRQGRCYLIALAIVDLLVGLLIVPERLFKFIHKDHFHSEHCMVFHWLDIFCELASITTLTIISIDRYYKILYPFRYKTKVTTERCVVVVVFIWIYSAAFAMLGVVPYYDETKEFWSLTGCGKSKLIYYLINFTVAFTIPCIIMMITYVLIFLAAYRRRRTRANQNEIAYACERNTLSKDLKNAKTLGIVMLSFVVCWGPFFLQLAFAQYFPALRSVCRHPYVCFVTQFFLPNAKSCCNPIVYVSVDSEYRNTFKNIFQKIFRKIFRQTTVSVS